MMQALTTTDMSNESFRWLTHQDVTLGGVIARAIRVNFVGELGWELHVRIDDHKALYDAIEAAGSEFGLCDFGMYAMESMRLEKSYRAWKVDLDHEYSPLRSGLNRFIDLKKPKFIGRDALLAESTAPLEDVFATLVLDEQAGDERLRDTDALYGCPILLDDEIVGYTTSGGYGHRLGVSIALGYVKPDVAIVDTKVIISVLGQNRVARVVVESPYDADNEKLRV